MALKIWNGRGHGYKYPQHYAYVAAHSMKQAAELLSMAFYGKETKNIISVFEVSNYYNKGTWGNHMEGIEATEPCVYLQDQSTYGSKPFRVI